MVIPNIPCLQNHPCARSDHSVRNDSDIVARTAATIALLFNVQHSSFASNRKADLGYGFFSKANKRVVKMHVSMLRLFWGEGVNLREP